MSAHRWGLSACSAYTLFVEDDMTPSFRWARGELEVESRRGDGGAPARAAGEVVALAPELELLLVFGWDWTQRESRR